MKSSLFASVALAVMLGGAAAAENAPVYIGSFTPITFRVGVGGQDPQTRANKAMDVANKYLGGKAPKVLQKPGKGIIVLMVQKDAIATVTTADVKAEKAKSLKVLADTWMGRLNKAFKESSAQK
jgi:hypothetical protein